MFKRKSVNLAALLALGAISAPVFAQQAQQLERIEVTGSRIKTSNPETASPVISLGAEAIKIEARRDVEGLLNNLPQVFADQGGEVSNGATGTANVNLRNLGSGRNLVLINGRRMPAGSPGNLSADLNQIPVSLIKRVEVLTGGASAIYGSDAISGVVNFIMNDKFEGVDLDLNIQGYNHRQHSTTVSNIVAGRAATNPAQFAVPGDKHFDGKTRDFALTVGSNFANNKGNATVFIGRKHTDALLQSERDFTACALNYAAPTGTWSCGGSSTAFPGRFSDFSTYNLTVADANGGVRNFSAATDQYNFGPTNYFQRPSNRTTAAAFVHYDANDMARVYAELNFHDDHTVAQIAPSGAFLGPIITVHYENPLFSQAWRTAFHNANVADGLGTFNKAGDTHQLLLGRRNVEGGGRQDDLRHTSYRGVVGVKGDLNSTLSYDVFAQTGRVVYQENYKNDFSITRSTRALDVVSDANGNPVCRSKLNGVDPNCVPYNIWALNKVTPEALAYVSAPGFQKGFTSQSVTGAALSGDLTDMGIVMPTARSGLGFSVGAERRVEKMELQTDTAFTTGDLAGIGGPVTGVEGQYSVNDVYAEFRLPLIEKKPMADLLNLTASMRRSSYSTGKSTSTYGLGLEYKPFSQLKVRGSFQNASRAANIIELFATRNIGLYDAPADPCSGASPSATLEQCQRTGVTAGQYGRIEASPAGQYNQLAGGNPNLKPEEAKSVTLGLVLQPSRDLAVTLDYFNIKVDDTISSFAPTVILQQCLTTGNPLFCTKVKRDSKGTLWLNGAYVEADQTNIGSVQTEGVDVGADYGMKLPGWGKLDLNLIGTYLKKFTTEDVPGLATYDCAGYFGDTCGTPLPVWRNKLRAVWTTPWDLQLAATWRHIAKVEFESRSTQERLTGDTSEQVPFLAARDYLDVAASYSLTKRVKLSVAVNNLLDKDPPLRTQGSGFVNGNTYPVVYDAAGRRVSMNVNVKF